MKKLSLHELTIVNLVNWPWWLKVGTVIITGCLIFSLSYGLILSAQMKQLMALRQSALTAQAKLQRIAAQTSLIPQYQQQLFTAQGKLMKLQRYSINNEELPHFLVSVAKIGAAKGLQINLIKPLPEKKTAFFTEHPLQLNLTGSYQQLAFFLSQLHNLNPIIILQDFTIRSTRAWQTAKTEPVAKTPETLLTLQLLAIAYNFSGGTTMAGPIKPNAKVTQPLPPEQVIQPDIILKKSVASILRDPFQSNLANHANLAQIDDPLEKFSLDSLKLKGIIKHQNIMYGLIEVPGGMFYRVTLGQRLGQHNGKIMDIQAQYLTVAEPVNSGAEILERYTKLTLQPTLPHGAAG